MITTIILTSSLVVLRCFQGNLGIGHPILVSSIRFIVNIDRLTCESVWRMWLIFTLLFIIDPVRTTFKSISVTSARMSSRLTTTYTETVWRQLALEHRDTMIRLLYPHEGNIKQRSHSVSKHPIYNFLHVYYRYSVADLLAYSPGINVQLDGVEYESDVQCKSNITQEYMFSNTPVLRNKYVNVDQGIAHYAMTQDNLLTTKAWDVSTLLKSKEILQNTQDRPAFYGCYGLHEWAMLYSGGEGAKPLEPHQDLPLRVSREVIDKVVEGGVRCTHFDAFRFFHPKARPLNVINPITRDMQRTLDQPGCIHANMDLFKYAYNLYPLVDAAVLRDSLALAIEARKVDMRASPYDVSAYCDPPICVETAEGRKEYVLEQERLADKAVSVRRRLLEAYTVVVDDLVLEYAK